VLLGKKSDELIEEQVLLHHLESVQRYTSMRKEIHFKTIQEILPLEVNPRQDLDTLFVKFNNGLTA